MHVNPSELLPEQWLSMPLAELARLAPVEELDWPELAAFNIALACKRDDLLHPLLSGNKFYKLHGHIRAFLASGLERLATFGGAYSNHIYATAAAGKLLGFATVGLIRGERPKQLSATLADAQQLGMELIFIDRATYRNKHLAEIVERWHQQLGAIYLVPEGGGDALGAAGCIPWAEAALSLCPWRPTVACVSAGTGSSAAGLAVGLAGIPLNVFLALKGNMAEVGQFQSGILTMRDELLDKYCGNRRDSSSVTLESNYHCGGYARFPAYLSEFVLNLEKHIGFTLDPVYTAKMFWGILQKAKLGEWPEGSRILVFHTGGVQGRRGFSALT